MLRREGAGMGSRWLVLLSTAVLNYSHPRCYCEYTNCGRELGTGSSEFVERTAQ